MNGRRLATMALVVGVVLATAGLALAAVGFLRAAGPDRDVGAEALARTSTLRGGVIELDLVEATDLTIFVIVSTAGLGEEEAIAAQRDAVHAMRCTVDRPGEGPLTIRGDRQGVGEGTGEVASVGWFSTGPGTVTVTCTSDEVDADRVVLLVPGRPSLTAGGVAFVVTGVLLLMVGVALAAGGLVVRRRTDGGRPGPLPVPRSDGSSDTVGPWT